MCTFFFVYSQNHRHFVSVHLDQLVYWPNAASRDFAQLYNAIHIVKLQEMDIYSHITNARDVYHHHIPHPRVTFGIETTGQIHICL